jgi:hypothetical protein
MVGVANRGSSDLRTDSMQNRLDWTLRPVFSPSREFCFRKREVVEGEEFFKMAVDQSDAMGEFNYAIALSQHLSSNADPPQY